MSDIKIYLLLGGNIGNREYWLQIGRDGIADNIGTITGTSSTYETAAWGNEAQDAYLNQVVAVSSPLTATDVLARITTIEQETAGRIRTEKWAPRTLDIDILFYSADVIALPGLHVPHPRIQDRMFALMPMAELAPDLVHPVFHKTIAQLMAECTDPLPVHLMKPALSVL